MDLSAIVGKITSDQDRRLKAGDRAGDGVKPKGCSNSQADVCHFEQTEVDSHLNAATTIGEIGTAIRQRLSDFLTRLTVLSETPIP
jgi:hypothetical protein